MIREYYYKGVPVRSRCPILRTVAKLRQLFDVPHRISVIVVPAPVVIAPSGECGFGAFDCSDPDRPRIWIGGLPPFRGKERNRHLAETVIHEFVHYEQWRDQKTPWHRGVPQRVARLMREIEET